jgi:hypothetical protein
MILVVKNSRPHCIRSLCETNNPKKKNQERRYNTYCGYSAHTSSLDINCQKPLDAGKSILLIQNNQLKKYGKDHLLKAAIYTLFVIVAFLLLTIATVPAASSKSANISMPHSERVGICCKLHPTPSAPMSTPP